MSTRTLETDSLITPRPALQIDLHGGRQARCSPFKGIFYFTGTVASLGAIGVGIYNIAVEPTQVMATVARFSLLPIGCLLLASVVKNMGDIFKQKEVVVVVPPDVQRTNVDREIILELRALLRLVEQVAKQHKIAIPNKPRSDTRASLNDTMNVLFNSFHQELTKAGSILNNYATLNHMLDQMLAALQISADGLTQFPLDQQATIKLRMIEQRLYQQNPESDDM